MRAPFQILVIPFRCLATVPEFAVLQRSDAGWWQFVAGGGEDAESPRQAATRETIEEIGITIDDSLMLPLDSMATVPKNCFAAAASWPQDICVIPEHCFAVDVGNRMPTLSGEHTELQWVSYDQACGLLKWDSNRNALRELNERLKRTPNHRRPTASITSPGAENKDQKE